MAREQCRAHVRAGRNFAFNATNITRQVRQRWKELFADYDARSRSFVLNRHLQGVTPCHIGLLLSGAVAYSGIAQANEKA